MDCNDSREIIQKLHGPDDEDTVVGHLTMELAMEHLAMCGQCKPWFTQNMCPLAQNALQGEDDDDESLGMIHLMLHSEEDECRYF